MKLSRRNFMKWAPGIAAMGMLRSAPLSASRGVPRIIVAGGGFAGLNSAQALKELAPAIDITVIDQHAQYVRCPGSNQVIAGFKPMETLIHHPAQGLMRKGIKFLQGTITGMDPHRRYLQLESGTRIGFDRLIAAPGIDFRWEKIEGYGQPQSLIVPHAWQAGTQTLRLKDQLAALPEGGLFMMTVPGNPYRCPPGPYERASLIAARLKQVNPRAKVLILDAKTKFSKEKGFRAAWASLYPGMVEWISYETEGGIDHIDVGRREVRTAFNRYQPDVLNVIPPQKAGKLAEVLGLTDETGWCPVDPITFQSLKSPFIHVIGDAASFGPVPKSAFAAQTEARACALAIALSLLDSQPPEPRLINHCYSLISPERAISVTGVYGIQNGGPLEALSLAESSPESDQQEEFRQAMDWFDLLIRTTFGT
jgi:sulfide dehydrogenase [flavocytochrome c] flavoprotein subunit